MENLKPHEYQFKSDLANTAYKHYYTKEDQSLEYLVIESCLNHDVINANQEMTSFERNYILEQQISTCLNTVPLESIEHLLERDIYETSEIDFL